MASNPAKHEATADGAPLVITPPSLIPAGEYSGTGKVTKLYRESGLVNDDVYFRFCAVNGPIPKVGETVVMQCEEVEDSKEFQWIARSLKVVPFTSLTSFTSSESVDSAPSHDDSSPDVHVIESNTNDTFEHQQNSGFAAASTRRDRPRLGSCVTAGNELTATFKSVNKTIKPSAPRSISPKPSATTIPFYLGKNKQGLNRSDQSRSRSRSKSPPTKTLRDLMTQLNRSKHSKTDRELVEISQQRLLVKEQQNEILEMRLRKRDIEDQKLRLEKQGLVEKLKKSEQQREIEKKELQDNEKMFQIEIERQKHLVSNAELRLGNEVRKHEKTAAILKEEKNKMQVTVQQLESMQTDISMCQKKQKQSDNRRKECQAENEQLKRSESAAMLRLQEELNHLNQKELHLTEIANQNDKMAEELETYRKEAVEMMTTMKSLGDAAVNYQSENGNLKKLLSEAELRLQEQEKRSRDEKQSSSLMLIEQKQSALQELDTCRNDMEELKKKQKQSDNQRKECQAQNEQLKKSETAARLRLQEELNQNELNLKEITNQKDKIAEELERYRKGAAEMMSTMKSLGEASVSCQSENVNLKKLLSQAELQLQEQQKRSRDEKQSSSLMLIEQKELALQELDTCRNDMEELKRKQKYAETFARNCLAEAKQQKKTASETQSQLKQERNKFCEMEKRLNLVTKKNQIALQDIELSQKEVGELKNRQAILRADNERLNSCESGARRKMEQEFEERDSANEGKLKEAIKQRQKTFEELEFCQKKIMELNRVQSDFQALTMKHQNENERLKTLVSEVTSGLEQKLEKHKETEARLLEIVNKNHILSQELEICQKKIVDLQEVQGASDAQTKKLLEDVIEYKTMINKAERQAEVDKNCIKQLEEKASHAKKESKEAKKLVTLIETRLTKAICREEEAHGLAREARAKLVKSKNQLEVAENAVIAANSMITEAKNQALKSKTKVNELKRCLADTEYRTLQAERQVEELQSRFNDVHNRSQLAEDRARQAESEIETLQTSLLEVENRAIKAESEVIQLDEKYFEATNETKQLKRHAEDIRTRLVYSESQVLHAEHQAEILKCKLDAIENKTKQVESETQTNNNEIDELKNELAEAKNHAEEVECQFVGIKGRFEDAARQLEEKRNQLALSENHVKQVETNYDEACRQLEKLKVIFGLSEKHVREVESNHLETSRHLQELKTELSLSKSNEKQAESNYVEARRHLKELEEKLALSESNAKQVESNYVEASRHLEELRVKLVSSEGHAKQSERNYFEASSHLKKLEEKLAFSESHAKQVESNYVEASSHLEELRVKLDSSEVQAMQSERNYFEASSHLKELEERLAFSESHAKEVESNYAEASRHLEELRVKLDSSEGQAKQSERNYFEASSHLKELEGKLVFSESHAKEVESKYVEASKHLEELKVKLDLSEGHAKHSEGNYFEASRHLKELEDKLAYCNSRAMQVNCNYAEASRQLVEAANEVEGLKRKLDFAENHINQIEGRDERSSQLTNQVEELKNKLLETNNRTIQHEIQALVTENRIKELEVELSDAELRHNQAEKRCEMFKSRLVKAGSGIKRANHQLQLLKCKLHKAEAANLILLSENQVSQVNSYLAGSNSSSQPDAVLTNNVKAVDTDMRMGIVATGTVFERSQNAIQYFTTNTTREPITVAKSNTKTKFSEASDDTAECLENLSEDHVKPDPHDGCSMIPLPDQLPELEVSSSSDNSNEASSESKREVGVVTDLKDSFGYINGNIYFEFSVVAGRLPKLSEKVVAYVESVPSSKVLWKARRVELLDPSAPQEAKRKFTRWSPPSIKHSQTYPSSLESSAGKARKIPVISSIANQSWDRQSAEHRDSSNNFHKSPNKDFLVNIKRDESAREYQSSGIGRNKRSSHDNMLQDTAGKRWKEHEHKH